MAAEDEVLKLEPCEADEDSVDEARPIRWWARAILMFLTVPWIAVLIVALTLNPYEEDGKAKKLGTHKGLGLPECSFKELTSFPCPSCGMTTSFSLVMHGDYWNSLQANFAGTALSTFGILFIPWAFASAFFGRFVWVRSLETVIFRLAIVFLVVLFGRWAVVLVMQMLSV